MQAVVHHTYSPTPDVLEVREIASPTPGPGEVLIDVRAAGLDRGVWHLMAGLPYAVRLAGFGVRAPKNPVLGMDVAGVVSAVGEGVTRFKPGDEVLGIGKGSFAEQAVAPEAKLVHKPADLSFEQAAAVAISGLTALQGVRDHGKVSSGDRVLVIGASGGVGSFAVQIAAALGADVTGVCSGDKAAMVRDLGARRAIDYAQEDFAETGPYDVVLDTGGNSRLARLRRALTPRGRLVIIGGEGGDRFLGGTHRQLHAMALSPFVSQKLGTFISSENREDLQDLVDLIEDGAVRPAVDRSFPLQRAGEAMDYLLAGRARGKVTLTP